MPLRHTEELERQFEQSLRSIRLPNESRNVLDAKLVRSCVVHNGRVRVGLNTPTSDALREEIEAQLRKIPGIDEVIVAVDAEDSPAPASTANTPQESVPRGASPATGVRRPQRKNYLDTYAQVIVVGSGKGGVGKSTVAVNLAIALKNLGKKVSLFDADIYGPSLPVMTGLRGTKPQMENERTIIPFSRYGIDLLSLGNLVDEAAATIWRGPIVHQVLEQLLRDTHWPGGDFMVIDLPPGTGDAQLTLSQLLRIRGAVIVSTPQDVALLDAIKAISMFRRVEVPVIGMVENMSMFACPHCGKETAIFDQGRAKQAGAQHGVPFLGRIPLDLAIRESGDHGIPITALEKETNGRRAFMEIATCLLESLSENSRLQHKQQ